MNAITICVQYDDFLRVTLPRNRDHFDRFLVVTTPGDTATAACAFRHEAEIFKTDAFYRDPKKPFCKGLAMEEGFDALGREGWICVLDADIVLPRHIPRWSWQTDALYSPYRRILESPSVGVPDERAWTRLPLGPEDVGGNREFAGYCQIFHADAPAIKGVRPWYGTHWPDCGGCDSEFWYKFPEVCRRRPDWEVLHLGPIFQNWTGRKTERLEA